MDFSLIVPAFIAGILTFLAPCTFPLVPAYLGFISGVSAKDLQDPLMAKSAKRKILLNGLFFILGFSVVFILFGTIAGFFGKILFEYRIWLRAYPNRVSVTSHASVEAETCKTREALSIDKATRGLHVSANDGVAQ